MKITDKYKKDLAKALRCTEKGDAYHWPTIAEILAVEIKRLTNPPHILVQDNDSHWYVIPKDKNDAWNDFCAIPSDDERAWDIPDFAEQVGGCPSLVLFKTYEIA